MHGDVWLAPQGMLELGSRTFTGAFGQMVAPIDVWLRGARLEARGVYKRYDYVCAWCNNQLESKWLDDRTDSPTS